MAIKKSASAARSYDRARTRASDGARSLFRDGTEDRKAPAQKITLELDADLYRALKVHAAQHDTTMRALVDRYVRDGLDADGVQA